MADLTHDAGLESEQRPGFARSGPEEPAACRWSGLTGLLQQSAAGDQDAFAALYDVTSELCFGLALRVLRDESVAERVAREAYLDLWANAGSYDPSQGSAIAWITRLVHRRAVDSARLQGPVRTKGAAALDHLLCNNAPADDRECLELAYFGGRTWCQVARVEHIEPVAAAVQIREGLLKL